MQSSSPIPSRHIHAVSEPKGEWNARVYHVWYQLTAFLAQAGFFIASFTNENHLIYTKR